MKRQQVVIKIQQACAKNNLSAIKEIVFDTSSLELVSLPEVFLLCAIYGSLEAIKYMLTLEELLKDKIKLKEICYGAINIACRNGNLELIRYFLESPQMPVSLNINEDRQGIYHACSLGHLQVIRYLISGESLVNKIDLQSNKTLHKALKWALECKQNKIANYFVFDLKIELTQEIQKMIDEDKDKFDYLVQAFNKRETISNMKILKKEISMGVTKKSKIHKL